MLGRKTMEVEILREALSKGGTSKTDIAADLVTEGRWPMKTVADTLGVSRSNLVERLKGRSKPRGSEREGPRMESFCLSSAGYGSASQPMAIGGSPRFSIEKASRR